MFMPLLTRSRLIALLVVAVAVGGACGSDDAAPAESDPAAPTSPPSDTTPPTDTTTSTDTTMPPTDLTAPTEDTTAPESTESVNAPTSTVAGIGDLGPTAQRLVDVAVADLVERFDLAGSPSPVEVVTVEEVTWRDSSIGCPMKGMQYTQVLTPGTRIVLQHDGTTFSYHAGSGRDPFYCARPDTPIADG